MKHLSHLKTKYQEFEKDLLEEEDLSNQTQKLQSERIAEKLVDNYIYSFTIPTIWIFFTLSRNFLNKFETLMTIHMIVSSLRGIIYAFIYTINKIRIKCKEKSSDKNKNINSTNESIKY